MDFDHVCPQYGLETMCELIVCNCSGPKMTYTLSLHQPETVVVAHSGVCLLQSWKWWRNVS